ncbi:MAG: glutathione S-transferase [Porticoccaceae bacterium]|nr:glutathione S-transferase [Porticoccaceae bacterium]
MPNTSILYSFRRCPYAMRARLAIKYSGVQVEIREVVLRNKPQAMLTISPKATVPVLQLPNGDVIDESWDIIHWATSQNDPDNLRGDEQQVEAANRLIQQNDNDFKQHLDHYKYADHFPEFSAEHYRTQAEDFLTMLDKQLGKHSYLLGGSPSLADIGIFPFIRQFAHVDIDWFRQTPHTNLHRWFEHYLSSELFASIMHKYKPWAEGQETVNF